MKKLLYLVIILVLVSGTASVFAATDAEIAIFNEGVNTIVGMLEGDFSLLLSGLGSDFDPILMQNAMVGQNQGMAELGSEKFNNFYLGLIPTVSITAANGLFTFRDTQSYEDSLVLKGLLDNMLFDPEEGFLGQLESDPSTEVLADILMNKAFPMPAFKISGGFRLPADLEVLIHGMWLPSFLIDMAVTNIPMEGVELPEGLALPSLNYVNIGAELRYILLRDSEDTPAMSIGLTGAYNNFTLSMGLGDLLGGMMGDMLPVPDGMEDPFADAGMTLSSSAIVFGINTSISKKLAIFYPFIRLGAWYGITNFGGEVRLTETAVIPGYAGHNDLDLVLSMGGDMLLGFFGTNLTIDYNLGSGVWGLNLGSRLQF